MYLKKNLISNEIAIGMGADNFKMAAGLKIYYDFKNKFKRTIWKKLK